MAVKNSSDILIAFTNALQPFRRVWLQAVTIGLAEFNLPMSVIATVIITSRTGDQGVKQHLLAEEVGVVASTMVRILDQGEAAGLLRRQESNDDRRVKMIYILPKGQELAINMEKVVRRLRTTLIGDMALADMQIATRVLRDVQGRGAAFLQKERATR